MMSFVDMRVVDTKDRCFFSPGAQQPYVGPLMQPNHELGHLAQNEGVIA